MAYCSEDMDLCRVGNIILWMRTYVEKGASPYGVGELLENKEKLTFTDICVEVRRLGDDYHILVNGGERPHIGCTVLAIPRPSLDGSGKMSSTASVLNVTGHKDEEVCRYLAEKVSAGKKTTVVCTGGIHMDGITKEQIAEIVEAMRIIAGGTSKRENRGQVMASKGVICLIITKL